MTGGYMFRDPLRRDPLVQAWALVMLVAGFVALSNNTKWSGSLEADRVAGFLTDLADAFLWSFFLLLLLAWLRAKKWPRNGAPRRRTVQAPRFRPGSGATVTSPTLPWTDRWLRDWREEDAQRPSSERSPKPSDDPMSIRCRHGATLDAHQSAERAPILRALATSHTLVRPGSDVSVTWCFEDARDVEIDGRRGHPACGEALVRVEQTRRVPVTGINRHGTTPVATPSIVAMAIPQLDLPTVDSPPIVSLRADVTAALGATTSATRCLDDFWQTHDSLRAQLHAQPRFIGAPPRIAAMPASVIDGIRRARPTAGKDTQ